MKKNALLFVILLFAIASYGEKKEAVVNGLRFTIDTDTKEATMESNYYEETTISVPDKIIWEGKKYLVTSIGVECFSECNNLTSVIIPSSVKSISAGCFSYSDNLKTITLPASITSLGEDCFNGCQKLEEITIPPLLTSLPLRCFNLCTNLKKVVIPKSVTSIGNECFKFCTELIDVTLPSNLTTLGEDAFRDCEKLKNITLPSTLTSIGMNCFVDCKELTSINIPASVTFIGDGCFGGCNSLTTFICNATTPPKVNINGFSPFGDIDKNCTLYVPKNSVATYKATSTWKDFAKILAIGDDPNGIDTPETSQVGIVVREGTVSLLGLNDSETVTFYTIDGKKIGNVKAVNGTTTYNVSGNQMVIAKYGNAKLKILTK